MLLGIAILLTVLLALLAVPVTVAVRFDRIEGPGRGRLSFRWLFGLVRFQADIPRAAGPVRQKKKRRAGKRKKRPPGTNARAAFHLLRQSSFRRHVVRFIRGVLGAIHGRDLYLRLRLGLGDPADTGRLWAVVGPVAGFASTLRGAEVRIEPEFIESALEVEGRGEIILVPLRLIAVVLSFAASPTTMRAIYIFRESRA